MIGISTAAPTSRKSCEDGGAAASQMVISGGTIIGHMRMPRPV